MKVIALLLLCAGTASAMSYYEILGLGRNVSMANLELALQNKRSIYKPDDHWTLQENKDAWLFYTCAALNVAVTHKLIDQYTYKRKHREWTCAATNVTFGVMKPVVANLTNHTRFVAAEIPAWRLATLNINVPPMNMTVVKVVPVAHIAQVVHITQTAEPADQTILTTVVSVGCVIVFGIIEIYMLAMLVHIFGVSGLFIDCALHVAFVAFQLHSCYVSRQCTWVEWE
jgi:hypothetical protein